MTIRRTLSTRPAGVVARWAIVTLLLGLAASRGAACGLCTEDKVAATYDAAVVARAASLRHAILFAALEGPVAGALPALADRIRRALAGAPGVDPGTVRVSLDPPAVSCAWNPARVSRARLIAAAERSLASTGIRIRPLPGVVLPGEPGKIEVPRPRPGTRAVAAR